MTEMKKIIIIDGGPRRNMNTAQMLQKFAEGAQSAGEHIEVKTYRLYDMDYKGCMSCMACKLKDRASVARCTLGRGPAEGIRGRTTDGNCIIYMI